MHSINDTVSTFQKELLKAVDRPLTKSKKESPSFFDLTEDYSAEIPKFSNFGNQEWKKSTMSLSQPRSSGRRIKRGRVFNEAIVNSLKAQSISSSTAALFLGVDESIFNEGYSLFNSNIEKSESLRYWLDLFAAD